MGTGDMPIIEADFSDLVGKPDRFANAKEALNLVLGPPGEGSFATAPGSVEDNKPRSAVFYPNTEEGRTEYLSHAEDLAASGRNAFFNSAVWAETEVSGRGLAINDAIQPLAFPALWCDVDKGLSEEARGLLKRLVTRSAILTYSGGTTEDGKNKFHIRILLDEPITDVQEFYELNRWLAVALGGEKYNPVSWLTLPGSTRFKPEYPEGKQIEVKIFRKADKWSTGELRELLAKHADKPKQKVTGAAAVDLEPVKPKRLPPLIREKMSVDSSADRSGDTYNLVHLCAERDLTQENALWVLQNFYPAVEKYGPALLPREVINCWPDDKQEQAQAPERGLLTGVRDGRWLDKEEFPELEWMIPEIMPEGLGMISAPPKAGKSFLVANIGLACAAGGKALGVLDVKQRPVFYLALEDSFRRLQTRFRELMKGGKIPRDIYVATSREIPPAKVRDAILEFLETYGDRKPLIMVDTLGVARSGSKKKDEGYQADYEFMITLKNAIDQVAGASLLLVHHSRKAESTDFIDSASGTQGLVGAVDFTLHLERKRQEKTAVLRLTGRDVEENAFPLTFQNTHWQLDGETLHEAAGKQDITSLGERSRDVYTYVSGKQRVTPAEVGEELDLSPQEASKYLSRLFERGYIDKRARGVYGQI